MYEIITTDTFLKNLKKYKKNQKLLSLLKKKLKNLKENPNIGKSLSKELHPSKSTRLDKKFRLIFHFSRHLKA